MDHNKNADKIEAVKESEMMDTAQKGSKGITYKTIGTTLQALSVQLDEGETIYSESGKMSWMTQNIKMETKSRGLSKVISRIFTGETLFVNHFSSSNGTGIVTFSTDQAGKIIPVELTQNGPAMIFQSGAFVCAENGVELSIAFTKRLSAGFFGGKGFIMQKVHGQGRAHLIADGEVVMYELSEGQEILVDQGNLIAFESTVDFDIQTVGGGLMNWFFGGEGIFLGVLRGPGKVWLQTRKSNLTATINTANGQYQSNNSFAQNPLGCIIGLVISAGVFGFFILMAILGALGGS